MAMVSEMVGSQSVHIIFRNLHARMAGAEARTLVTIRKEGIRGVFAAK
jgi:hypothetical protein